VFGLVAFTVTAAVALSILGREVRERDIATGVIMTFTLGMGVLFLSLYRGYAQQAYSILFGTVVGISRPDVLSTALLGLGILAAVALLWRPLLFSSYDPELAETRGVAVQPLAAAFLVLIALTISIATQVVGTLLVFALLVGPAATAIRLVHRPGRAVILAVALGLAYTWLGIFFAANSPWPVSFFIATFSFGVYLPVRLLRPAGVRRDETVAGPAVDRGL
jgi:zinc/manganese transport system permease protein